MSPSIIPHKRGAALIEAALAIPLLLTLFAGVLFATLGFTSYAITSLDVVTAYVFKDGFDYQGTLQPQALVHGHPVSSFIDVAATDEDGLVFANLASGRAMARSDPFGTPVDSFTATYAFSSAAKMPLAAAPASDQVYSVNRTFIPWIRGMEYLSVKSSVVGSD